jgi:DNA-binding MarR family transcriptional regulator
MASVNPVPTGEIGAGLNDEKARPSSYPPESPSQQNRALKAKRLYAQRREREKILGTSLFSEPAWDILLDLFVAHHSQKMISAHSACIGAAVPQSTALRHLRVLEDRGLVMSVPDAVDGRRRYVTLTATALDCLSQLLDSL